MAACRKRKGNPDRKRNDEKKQISGGKRETGGNVWIESIGVSMNRQQGPEHEFLW